MDGVAAARILRPRHRPGGVAGQAPHSPLQSGLTKTTPQGAVTDSALVALGTVLVVIPGLASSILGLLLLLPPTRAAARPLVTAMAVRGIGRRVPLITVATPGASGYRAGRGDYIDGEVIDVFDVEPQRLPRQPD